MSYARAVHHQQLRTIESVGPLTIAIAFILLVVLPGGLTLLGQLVNKFIM